MTGQNGERGKRIKMINFNYIEKKWQKAWRDKGVFLSKEDGDRKKKYYVCEMFPYPSASFLHMGHVKNYSIGDCIARYKRMRGFNVMYPMGFDAFGLPAENAAIKEGVHPRKYTDKAIVHIKRAMQSLGLSYDWNRELRTCDSDYYRWNQWLFLRMLEKGVVYRKKAPVNWCSSCRTVLANEEVVDGKCWRCDSEASVRKLEQWFVRITQYADELLKGLEDLDWPSRVKELQKNWIGRSEGVKVLFPVKGSDKTLEVFTTRVDTIYGATFVALSLEHEFVEEFVRGTRYEKKYREMLKDVSASEKLDVNKEKKGFFTGRCAVHPLTNQDVPIYAGTFVVGDYGTGAVMGVPAHDSRDWDFAKKHKIEVKQVIIPVGNVKLKEAYEDEKGVLINSDAFNGLSCEDAKGRIEELLRRKGLGSRTREYRLRDWLISRQRYWGTPIPIVYCKSCGVVPVPEKDLPVLLPENVKFTGKGNPLEASEEFTKTNCPCCKEEARRETDTMATFFDSSWYYLRYCSPKSYDIFDRKSVEHWMPIDQYIGGIEHAVLHLLYARFFVKFLRDLGWLTFDEPFTRLFNQGIVHKEGKRMSKSNGNVVTPEEISTRYGIDSARFFLFFVAGADKDMEWDERGVEGAFRVVQRFMSLVDKTKEIKGNEEVEHKLNKTLLRIEESYEKFEFNKGLIAFSEFVNYLSGIEEVPKSVLEKTILMISPIIPHISEEMWNKLGHESLVAQQLWPRADKTRINERFDLIEKARENVIGDIANIIKLLKEKQNMIAKKVYLYALPDEVGNYSSEQLSKHAGLSVEVFAVNDKLKHDPQNKSSKAKPGRPAIYVE